MHVLIVPSWYKNSKNPVLGSFFEEQARGLLHFGCKVAVLHINFLPYSSNEKIEEYILNDDNLQTYYYSYKAIVPRNRRLNYWLLCRFAFKKFKLYCIKYGVPDIIHSHCVYYGGIIADYISHKARIPFLTTEHLTNFCTGDIKIQFDFDMAKRVFNNAKINIAVSTTFKNGLLKFLKLNDERFVVIPNMVSPIFSNDFKPQILTKDKAIRFFSVSFLAERKNITLQIHAFKIFVNSFPNSELVIGGGATSKEDEVYVLFLKQLIDKLNLRSNVKLIGPLNRDEVKKEIDKCHIFLSSSTYETFGVVLVEALSCGRPVISTDSHGPRDIINENNGILVRSFDPDVFCQAMIRIANSYDLFNQEKIREECLEKFGEMEIVRRLLNIYGVLNIQT